MDASSFLTFVFVGLVVVVAVGAVFFVRAAYSAEGASRDLGRVTLVTVAVLALVLGLTGGLAAAGLLNFDGRPPSIMLLIGAVVIASVALVLSGVGKQLSSGVGFPFLIGFQAFRFPLELIMYRAAAEGVMPVQMSLAGLNFDVVTGTSAIVVALLVGHVSSTRARRALIRVWNVVGFLLLTNIVTVAVLSMPLFDFFEKPNVWIKYFPFIWLPAFLVPLALMGHILVWRRLKLES